MGSPKIKNIHQSVGCIQLCSHRSAIISPQTIGCIPLWISYMCMFVDFVGSISMFVVLVGGWNTPPDGCWYCSGDHQWSSQPTSWTVPFRPPVPSPNESWWIGCGYPFPVPGCLDPGFLVHLHMDLMVIRIGNIYWRAFKPGRILGVATMCKQTQIYSQTERGRRKNHVPWNGNIIGM